MTNVILIRGKAGVGKTTLTNALSKHLKLPVIRKDTIYNDLAGSLKDHEQINQHCERILRALIQINIQNGVDILVDHSCHYPEHYLDFRSWVDSQHAQLKSVLLTCSDETLWKERFDKRRLHPNPNNRITDFDALKKHYGSLETEPYKDELFLDNTGHIDLLVSEITRWLNKV